MCKNGRCIHRHTHIHDEALFAKDELFLTNFTIFNCSKLIENNTKLSNVGVFARLRAEERR